MNEDRGDGPNSDDVEEADPATEGRVKDIFEGGLLNEAVEGAEENMSFVVDKLRRFPHLASTRYLKYELRDQPPDLFRNNENKWYPFMHLLHAGAQTGILKEIYDMFPDVLRWNNYTCVPGVAIFPPISVACYYRYKDSELIRFLAKRSNPRYFKDGRLEGFSIPVEPFANGFGTFGHVLPIHVALRQTAPKATIEALLQFSAEMAMLPELTGSDCYTLACLAYGDRQVRDLVLNCIRKVGAAGNTSFLLQDKCALRLYNHDPNAIDRLLACTPELSYLLDHTPSQNQGLVQFFHSLSRSTQVRELSLCCPENVDIRSLSGQELEDVIKENKSLKKLDLSFRVRRNVSPFVDQCLRSMVRGLANNESLVDLSLCGIRLRDAICLNLILGAPTSPKKLTLRQVYVAGGSQLVSLTAASTKMSQLTEIHIDGMDISSEHLHAWIMSLASLPLLRFLTLKKTTQKGVRAAPQDVQPLLDILTKNRLELLNLRGSKFNMAPLFHALKHNTSLAHLTCGSILNQEEELLLELLDSHIRHLSYFVCKNSKLPEGEQRRMKHFLSLNLFGRWFIKHGLTPRKLVKMLAVSTHEKFKDWVKNHRIQVEDESLEVFNIQYGLLRHCPVAWCLCTEAMRAQKGSLGKRKLAAISC